MTKKFILPIVITILAVYVYNLLLSPQPVPVIEDIVWKQSENLNDNQITPFTIRVPQRDLEYLKQRLQNTTYVPPLQGVNFQYGFDTNHLRKIVDYWANKYNWREREKQLNGVPHFKTQISGLNIHFIRVKPDPKLIGNKKVLPLLLLHGWPGSVKEFYGIFPLLTTPRKEHNFVFEVIAPSLPSFGFSDAATIPGLNPAQIGLVMVKLMNRLGFEKFYVQAGNWGAAIANDMATLFPKSVIGYHCNMCGGSSSAVAYLQIWLGSFFPDLIVDKRFKHKLYPISNLLRYIWTESGYMHIQATKPDTIGVALNDSPVGLAAYILEKFSTWTNANWRNLPDGGLKIHKSSESKYSIDDLLDNVMIYWATNSITSAMRLYANTFSSKYLDFQMDEIPTDVPVICSNYPDDIVYLPEFILRRKFKNLVCVSHMPRGGHFIAFEEPVMFSDDVWKGICLIENRIYDTKHSC